MAKKFSELVNKMSPERQQRIREGAATMMREVPFEQLRQARNLTQHALAEQMGSSQAAVSKLERRADMYISSLRSYIEAMGGELNVVAQFPDGVVRITHFGETALPTDPPRLNLPTALAAQLLKSIGRS